MKIIKKIGVMIAAVVAIVIAILKIASKKNAKKIKAVKKDISANKKKTKEVDAKLEEIRLKRVGVSELIDMTDEDLENLQIDLKYIKDPKKSLNRLKKRAKKKK
tara:strand:+ start:522 stop:833 length:312 start_codon:yes stop_codon:yes gene_type:complete